MTDKYDVIVIGAGPAGYVASIRCAQLGLKTACVDRWINKQGQPALGGTCLNVGCIPSKALLESSEQFEAISEDHGISVADIKIDVSKIIARKDKIVSELTGGIEQLFKTNKIDWLQGTGILQADKQVLAQPLDEADTQTYAADNIIIATGSSYVELSAAPLTTDRIVDNEGTLNWNSVPQRLGIIDAGVIGLELGSVWRRLGVDVVILEAMDKFLAAGDTQIAKAAQREFKKQGLDIRLGTRINHTQINEDDLIMEYSDKQGEQKIAFDRIIVAVGRRPNSTGIAAEGVALKLDDRGRVAVNGKCETTIPGVYTIGDDVRGPMLAHKGSEEGVAVAETMAGQQSHLDFDYCPWVIYTEHEIAWVGKTEAQLKDADIGYHAGAFPFAANGRARAMNKATGLVKILADTNTDRVLGVHIVGPMASELIGQAVIAMESENTAEDLARSFFSHPSLSESLHEAALAVDQRAIHSINRPRK